MSGNSTIDPAERARKAQEVAHRLQYGPAFSPADIVYSASLRCPCGAGLAYPVGIGPYGYWTCSLVLLGEAGTRHAKLGATGLRRLFREWDIAAETDLASLGATTRPSAPAGTYPASVSPSAESGIQS